MAKKPVQIYLEEETIKQLQNRRGNLSDNVRSAINDYLKGTTTIHDFHEAPKAQIVPSITEDLKQEIANEVLKKATQGLVKDSQAGDLFTVIQKYEPYIPVVMEFVKGMATNLMSRQPQQPQQQAPPMIRGIPIEAVPITERFLALRSGQYQGMPIIVDGHAQQQQPVAPQLQPVQRLPPPPQEIPRPQPPPRPPEEKPQEATKEQEKGVLDMINNDLQEKIKMATDFIKKMENEEFKSIVEKKEDLLGKYKTFLPMLPKVYKEFLKNVDFIIIQNTLVTEAPEKAKILDDLNSWDYLEEQFKSLREVL